MRHTSWMLVRVFILVGGGLVAHDVFPPHSVALVEAAAIAPGDSSSGLTSAGVAVTLDGVLVCLPQRHGSQEVFTLACAVGLRTTDGKLYALENINPYLIMGKATMGQQVRLSGRSRPSTDPRFDTIGTIEIISVDARDASPPVVNQ